MVTIAFALLGMMWSALAFWGGRLRVHSSDVPRNADTVEKWRHLHRRGLVVGPMFFICLFALLRLAHESAFTKMTSEVGPWSIFVGLPVCVFSALWLRSVLFTFSPFYWQQVATIIDRRQRPMGRNPP
jgi:hypothetical protein